MPDEVDYETDNMAIKITKDGREILTRKHYADRRREVWERDNQRCVKCHRIATLEEAEIDHKRTRGMGGGYRDDRMEALQTLCHACHWAKHHSRHREVKEMALHSVATLLHSVANGRVDHDKQD